MMAIEIQEPPEVCDECGEEVCGPADEVEGLPGSFMCRPCRRSLPDWPDWEMEDRP